MLARDFVAVRVGPFVGTEFRKSEFFHRPGEAHWNAGTFESRVILDPGPAIPKASQHLLAIVPDTRNETETGHDDAPRVAEAVC